MRKKWKNGNQMKKGELEYGTSGNMKMKMTLLLMII
jgi:hypothetical protein